MRTRSRSLKTRASSHERVPAKLLCDENIPAKTIDALRDGGGDVNSVREIAPGMADAEVLRQAVAHGCILVTFDRDFGELIFRQGQTPPPSVIYFRSFPLNPEEFSDEVLSLISDPDAIVG